MKLYNQILITALLLCCSLKCANSQDDLFNPRYLDGLPFVAGRLNEVGNLDSITHYGYPEDIPSGLNAPFLVLKKNNDVPSGSVWHEVINKEDAFVYSGVTYTTPGRNEVVRHGPKLESTIIDLQTWMEGSRNAWAKGDIQPADITYMWLGGVGYISVIKGTESSSNRGLVSGFWDTFDIPARTFPGAQRAGPVSAKFRNNIGAILTFKHDTMKPEKIVHTDKLRILSDIVPRWFFSSHYYVTLGNNHKIWYGIDVDQWVPEHVKFSGKVLVIQNNKVETYSEDDFVYKKHPEVLSFDAYFRKPIEWCYSPFVIRLGERILPVQTFSPSNYERTDISLRPDFCGLYAEIDNDGKLRKVSYRKEITASDVGSAPFLVSILKRTDIWYKIVPDEEGVLKVSNQRFKIEGDEVTEFINNKASKSYKLKEWAAAARANGMDYKYEVELCEHTVPVYTEDLLHNPEQVGAKVTQTWRENLRKALTWT